MTRIVLEPLQKSTLADWFETDAGRYVLAWESAQVDNAVEDVFGFNAAQVGLPAIDYLNANRMPLRFKVGADCGCTLVGDPARLPIASQSLDLIVLPHVLEFCANPHQVLREAERVLMPEGQIVISGFNPISLWGVSRLVGGRRQEFPWRGEFVGLLRLRDWLKLLGFELNGGKFGCYAPPFSQSKWLQRFRMLEAAGERWWPIAGGVYVVRAIKRVVGMRVVTPAWRRDKRQTRAVATIARRERSTSTLRLIQANPLLTPPLPDARHALRAVPKDGLDPDED